MKATPDASGPLYTLLADLLACRTCSTGRTGRVLDTVVFNTQRGHSGGLEVILLAPLRTILVIQGAQGTSHMTPWGPDLDFSCF